MIINDEKDYLLYLKKQFPNGTEKDNEFCLKIFRHMCNSSPDWPKKLTEHINSAVAQ